MKPRSMFYLVAGLFAAAAICAWLSGCATAHGQDQPVPNLSQVDPGIWRGGQPTIAGWKYLQSTCGVSNVVKLNPMEEGSDKPAVDLGMRITAFCPIDTMEQLVTGPDRVAVSNAVYWIRPGTFVHCEFGQDRTGLVIGMYRLTEGTNKATAWQEMTNHGYHPALAGLTCFWRETPEPTNAPAGPSKP